MPIVERSFDSLDDIHATELEHLRIMFESGTPLAASATMAYCVKHGLIPPPWSVIASANMHLAEKRTDVPKKHGGRSSGVVSRYLQDAIDYVRWDTVVEIREQRVLLQKEAKILAALKGQPAKEILKERMKMLGWIGTGSNFIFECASALLAETDAHGKESAIKRSYQKVQGNMRTPATAARHHILDREFLIRFRDSTKDQGGQAKKIVPFYDLMP